MLMFTIAFQKNNCELKSRPGLRQKHSTTISNHSSGKENMDYGEKTMTSF